MIPAELLTKYGLQQAEALRAIEFAIARALIMALRKNLAVRIEDRLEITEFPHLGEPIELPSMTIKRKLRRHIIHQVELELQKRQVMHEAEELKELRGKNVIGEVSRIANDGTLYVTLEIADVFRHLILAGECPLRFQPSHERSRYRIGDVREFFVSSVLPIVANGRSARVRIRLNRITKELPALLLMELTGVAGIICRRRVAGGFSDIVTPVRIPKDSINSVGKELGEHLNVFIFQAAKR